MASPRPSKRHETLGPDFFDKVRPATFPEHRLRWRNAFWAKRVGLHDLSDAEWIEHFGRFRALPGSFDEPLALRYHGHQFRAYNPELGDGRGFLFAQLHDLEDGRLLDLGTKGSGRTPWSRTADGRLTLKGGVRELLASEMLESLGVDTSKTFSLIETGEELERHDEPSPTRSAVLVRLSHSHIRIGSFQRVAFLRDQANLERLLHYAAEAYFPELAGMSTVDLAPAFLSEVARRVAETGGRWSAAGFVHGVLNTDNINITGESFDYGPWRILPTFDPGFTAAYFDQSGLYAFGRQGEALAWNLARLGECLLPFSSLESLNEALNIFAETFSVAVAGAFVDRLGLMRGANDQKLVAALFEFLASTGVGFEQALFDLRGGLADPDRLPRSPQAEAYRGDAFAPVRSLLNEVEPAKGALDARYFSAKIPFTMLIDDMEALWTPIAESDDWQPLYGALEKIAEMGRAYGNRTSEQA